MPALQFVRLWGVGCTFSEHCLWLALRACLCTQATQGPIRPCPMGHNYLEEGHYLRGFAPSAKEGKDTSCCCFSIGRQCKRAA
eukprot:3421821-Amphidinium_carterae.3